MVIALARIIQLVGASFHTPKGWGFDSWSGHMPRLWVPSAVGVSMGGNRLMFLSHINFHLSPTLPPTLTSSLLKNQFKN